MALFLNAVLFSLGFFSEYDFFFKIETVKKKKVRQWFLFFPQTVYPAFTFLFDDFSCKNI